MCARVLVVDDDPVNVELLGYLLRAFGHAAVLSLDGPSALREADAEVPDLVLCDIQMPQMDGFEVLRSMRRDKRLAATPIIGVTALAMVGDREKILAAGFDGYLAKPITPETFVTDIEKYLSSPPPSRATLQPSALVPERPAAAPLSKRVGFALVVDDIPANLELMTHLFSSLGVEVRVASSVREALLVARAARPQVIISDMHMPGSDGLALLQQVRSDSSLKDLPFVIVSSSGASVEEERRAIALGVDGVLLRPLDAEEMLEYLARWMPVESRS
jgi:two-component system, cell cycle response regulator